MHGVAQNGCRMQTSTAASLLQAHRSGGIVYIMRSRIVLVADGAYAPLTFCQGRNGEER